MPHKWHERNNILMQMLTKLGECLCVFDGIRMRAPAGMQRIVVALAAHVLFDVVCLIFTHICTVCVRASV